MAVLIEGISVVVRCDSIQRKFAGGVSRFSAEAAGSTLWKG